MTRQTFRLNDGSTLTMPVISQKSRCFEEMDIQISKVIDTENLELMCCGAIAPYRYIYEEISKDDFVIYARFMGKDNIANNFRWALEGGAA
ncbi:MAG: hypothetical protein LBG57_04445 [Treponema sp.]|jgi:hypothetical protein|nr:hypothetical protein [Treponema sp.]